MPQRVTVVIPAYKAEATIRRAVGSVLAQEGVEPEVIVVVDGRLDNTAQQLENYDPARVKVLVNEQNRGSQYSRNRGLSEAKGEFVMFLDCDDFLEGPMLRGLAARLCAEPADIAFGPMQVLKEATGERRPVIYRSYRSADELFRLWMADAHTVAPCSIMWRAEYLRRIGGWDESIRRNQDGEVVMRTILTGGRFAVSREGRGVYVEHRSPDRITARPENLPSSIDVGEKIFAAQTDVVSARAKREGLAGYFYRISLRFYRTDQIELAERALGRARELGFRGHAGPLWHRASASILGLPLRYRITNFIKRRRLFGFDGL
jgi:glycosyltransferase involved in cell wall biosynthesis